MRYISIKGASVHNLKDIDVDIPKNTLTVVTGVSGSGKSSLVFDIIFEEGRRQYLQSLGMLPEIVERNDFDSITGIGPTVAVQQSIIRQSNPRSTVGTKTRLLGLLGVLYASDGVISCSACGRPVGIDLVCQNCGNQEERLPASYFSYNSPNGMCLKCMGRGVVFELDLKKLIPDEGITLEQIFDSIKIMPYFYKKFSDYVKMPFSTIPDEVKNDVLYGHLVSNTYKRKSLSISRILRARVIKGEDTGGLATFKVCPECYGYRIGEEARRVFLNGKHIGQVCQMTIGELGDFLETVGEAVSLTQFGNNMRLEILRMIRLLIKNRLGHLSLYREMPTLSGGELQRLFLTAHLDSKMDSLIYILDEPTIGLHESEKQDLLNAVNSLKELGNTVILVEHDRNSIQKADHIIDMGPKAGIEGGKIVYKGDLKGLLACEASITGKSMNRPFSTDNELIDRKMEINTDTPRLIVHNARANNLKNLTASFPLGGLVGVAGVSGSGKSSLVSDTLIPLLESYFHEKKTSGDIDRDLDEDDDDLYVSSSSLRIATLEGMVHLTGYTEVTQSPIGRHQNSNPATYTGIWSRIRTIFASQPEAQEKGYSAGFFSFNAAGACRVCNGSGQERIWLGGNYFVYNICRACHGKRYQEEALSVRYKDKTIADVLDMRVSEALDFFSDHLGIISVLKVLDSIGMGYIGLGQPAPSLSGGEAQRIKLAREIGRRRKGSILYVLDEPTTGLSQYDTEKLVLLMKELVQKGNSVLVIEHDPGVLSVCDWIIELGPGSGPDGGWIITEGPPLALKENPQSLTGTYLYPCAIDK